MAISEETREHLARLEDYLRGITENIPELANKTTKSEATMEEFIGTVAADVAVVADALADVIGALRELED